MTTISPCESLLLLLELSWKFRNFHSIHLLGSSAAFSIFSTHPSHQPRRPSRPANAIRIISEKLSELRKKGDIKSKQKQQSWVEHTQKKKGISRVGGRKEKGMKENGAATTTSLRALRVLFIRYFFLTPFAFFFEISLLCFMFYVFSSACGGCEKRERGFFDWRFSFFFIFGCCLCMLDSAESRKIQRKNGDGMLEEEQIKSARLRRDRDARERYGEFTAISSLTVEDFRLKDDTQEMNEKF